MANFEHVVVLSDGIRGHYHQAVGIANWLHKLGDVQVDPVINVPVFQGFQKLLHMKFFVRNLESDDPAYPRNWLRSTGVRFRKFAPGTLFISAGGPAAPYCLAFARATKNKCCCIMTPSVLGTKPFDFAIIPSHDKHDPKDKNIFVTLGAPNHICPPELDEVSQAFFGDQQFTTPKVVGVAIGGGDSNYKITPRWVEDVLSPLRYVDDATILITTSRRSGPAVDAAVERVFSGAPSVGRMLLMSRKPGMSLLSAMFGRATHVLATEDSISIVSEAVTAGFKVGLIRVDRITGRIKKMLGYGAQRFDATFDEMIKRGLIQDLGDIPNFDRFLEPMEQRHIIDFSEARRAAEWILDH
ncbi:MAG: mitochondrial fission ELM1 family protein [Synergistaceae bacterium]|nr:mitochondrial fission ELM1 family protein [Synergistaceae bacterium]MBQ9404295.1 mitochondrial fission ELM1 family protein [Synergistaceae bacterium]MBR0203175.1 mitochondrial fission ELM1 family protein [Synergistaceae bacterium]